MRKKKKDRKNKKREMVKEKQTDVRSLGASAFHSPF